MFPKKNTKLFIIYRYDEKNSLYSVKPPHAVTSIKQSPVLKGHLFLVLSKKISYELNLF
jgi:hypothetical protein